MQYLLIDIKPSFEIILKTNVTYLSVDINKIVNDFNFYLQMLLGKSKQMELSQLAKLNLIHILYADKYVNIYK